LEDGRAGGLSWREDRTGMGVSVGKVDYADRKDIWLQLLGQRGVASGVVALVLLSFSKTAGGVAVLA
jgi:hypothetical protein